LLLTGGDTGGDFFDATRHLLLAGDDPVDALSQLVEVNAERLLIEKRRGWRTKRNHVGSALGNRLGLRC
jgi:hypothetical protein